MNFEHLENAFGGNLVVSQYYLENEKKVNYSIVFTRHTIGTINITSGKIVACDGMVSYGSEPLKPDIFAGLTPNRL